MINSWITTELIQNYHYFGIFSSSVVMTEIQVDSDDLESLIVSLVTSSTEM